MSHRTELLPMPNIKCVYMCVCVCLFANHQRSNFMGSSRTEEYCCDALKVSLITLTNRAYSVNNML